MTIGLIATQDAAHRGSSGAQIIISDDHAIKLDTARTGRRVQAQGRWLWSYPMSHTPYVKRVLYNGYVMERLEPIEYDVSETMPYVRTLWHALLSAQLRVTAPKVNASFVKLDRDTLHKYVKDLAADVDVPSTLGQYVRMISWPEQLRWTHGDPILDNLLIRTRANGTKQYVLSDPIPPTYALPSLAVVDYGRIIQSAAGYEPLRYLEADVEDWRANVNDVLDYIALESGANGFDVSTIQASLFYSVVHMLRGARTAKSDDQRERLIQRVHDLEDTLTDWL